MKKHILIPIIFSSMVAPTTSLLCSCKHDVDESITIEEAAKTQNASGSSNIATYEFTLANPNHIPADFTITTDTEMDEYVDVEGVEVNSNKLIIKIRPFYAVYTDIQFDMTIKVANWEKTFTNFHLVITEQTETRKWFTKYHEIVQTFRENFNDQFKTVSLTTDVDKYNGENITSKKITYYDMPEVPYGMYDKTCWLTYTAPSLGSAKKIVYVGGITAISKSMMLKERIYAYQQGGYPNAKVVFEDDTDTTISYRIDDGQSNTTLWKEVINKSGYTTYLDYKSADGTEIVHLENTYSK